MLRKVSLTTTILAALALPVGATLLAAGAATLAPTEAVAKKKAKSHGRKHYSGKRHSGKRYSSRKRYSGRHYSSRKRYSSKRYSYRYRGRRSYSYRRYTPRRGRFYRGRYWSYGIGACWRFGRYGYVWVCL